MQKRQVLCNLLSYGYRNNNQNSDLRFTFIVIMIVL